MMPILTLGHSNHPWTVVAAMLEEHNIDVLVDIRSKPYSGYRKEYNRPNLEKALPAMGKKYLWMPDLGGRPADRALLSPEGKAAYHRMAQMPAVATSMDRLVAGSQKYQIALFCSEENPLECHRHRLLWPLCQERGLQLLHIRAKGPAKLQDAATLADPRGQQLGLLGDSYEGAEWWSLKPVISLEAMAKLPDNSDGSLA